MPPLAIAFFILVATALVGFAITYVRRRTTLRGYEEHARDIHEIKGHLNAAVFRDGDDVVISGALGRYPAQVRFSYAQNTPGVNTRVLARAGFPLSVTRRSSDMGEGRVLLRTGDEMFDSRFSVRTDQPIQAKIFLGSRTALSQVQKLCCSMSTSLTFATGLIEHNETTVPEPYTGRHIQVHLDSMHALATMLERMPGADQVEVMPAFRDHTSWAVRGVVAAGMLAAFMVVWSAAEPQQEMQAGAPDPAAVAGVRALDAPAISGIQNYRLAPPDAIHGAVRNWAASSGITTTARIGGNFLSAEGPAAGAAYLLLGKRQEYRIVIVENGNRLYDAEYPFLAGMVRVPRSSIPNVEWTGAAPGEPDGDGLLIVRDPENTTSAVLIFFHQGRLASGVPSNYQSVNLR